MADIGRLVAVIDGDLSGLQRSLQSAQKQLSGAGRTMTSAGRALSLGVTAPILAIGTAAVSAGMDFQSSMNRVKALTGATGDDFDALSSTAKELGRTTAFSASQAADGMGFLAMAGFDANEIVGAMPGVLQLASAANLDLARSADIVSNILTGYGMEVEELAHANDVLVKAMTSANVDLSMLGESFKYAGPIAKAAGLSFEETAAAIGLMGNAGIQGSMAGTAIRGAITRLLKPTKEVSDTMNRLGLNVTDTNGQLLPLHDILGQLERSGADTADLMALFGQRAGPAMAALLDQGSEALIEFTGELEESGGTAQRIADTQMEGLRGAWLRLKSAWEGLMISIAEAGILDAAAGFLSSLAGAVQGLVERLENLPSGVKSAIIVIAGIAAALGPMLIIVGTIMTNLAALAPIIAGVAGAFGLLLSPIGLVVVAIGALAVAFATDFLGIRSAVEGVIEKVGELAHLFKLGFDGGAIGGEFSAIERAAFGLGEFVREEFIPRWNDLREAVRLFIHGWQGGDIGGKFSDLQQKAFEMGQELREVFDWLKTAAGDVVGFISDHWPEIKSVIGFVIDDVMERIGGLTQQFEGIVGIVSGVVQTVKGIFEGDWSEAWEGMKTAAEGVLDLMIGNIRTMFGKIPGMILSFAGEASHAASEWAKSIFNAVINWLKDLPDRISGIVTDAISRLNPLQIAVNALPGGGIISAGANVVEDFFRHSGGPVTAGVPYIVKPDEEVFIPDVNGYVQPLGRGGAGVDGAGVTVNVGTMNVTDPRKDTGPIGDLGWSLVSALQSRGVTI